MMRRILSMGLVLAGGGLLLAACDSGDSETSSTSKPSPKPEIEVVQSFICEEDAVTKTTPIADIAGLDGADLAIRPTESPCQFDLIFRDGKGGEHQLSISPAGYLLGMGGVTPDGEVLACASRIDHGKDPSPENDLDAKSQRVTNVSIECAVKTKSGWTEFKRVVDPKGKWAAWIGDMEVSTTGTTAYRVNYTHDASFQFLNLHNEGRPKDDGIYQIEFAANGTKLTAPTEKKLSDDVVPDRLAEGWEPTDEQKKEFAPYIDFGEGECPAPGGCPE